MTSASRVLAAWGAGLSYGDLPPDVVTATKLRLLDVIGLAAAGGETPFGRAVCRSFEPNPGGAPVIGTNLRLSRADAALANGALAQALEFDDTHNESVVHVSAPSVAAALALTGGQPTSGATLLTAIATGNEIASRVGVIAPGQFHKRGFHPTGLFSPVGTAVLAGQMMGLEPGQIADAVGTVGSFCAGLLQCWVDGTDTKYLHPGWAAHAGIMAARLAQAGVSGPDAVLEGRFGLFASHLGEAVEHCDFGRATRELGGHWESRGISFKPYPAAHVIHPYLDAALGLMSKHGLASGDIVGIEAPVAPYIVPIVCEPVSEKARPLTAAHARVSLQFSLAEAIRTGRLDKRSFGERSLQDRETRRLADCVVYHPDETFPGPSRFKGAIRLRLSDGRTFEAIEEHNRGSKENPMSPQSIEDKFRDNSDGVFSRPRQDALIELIDRIDQSETLDGLLELIMSDETEVAAR